MLGNMNIAHIADERVVYHPAASQQATCAPLAANMAIVGHDLLCNGTVCPRPAQSADECCKMCGSKPIDTEPKGTCKAWTWSAGLCHLKLCYGPTPPEACTLAAAPTTTSGTVTSALDPNYNASAMSLLGMQMACAADPGNT